MAVLYTTVAQSATAEEIIEKSRFIANMASVSSKEEAFRSHADFISLDFILPFLKMAKELNQDFDIMVEAKKKNLAMQRLVVELAAIRGVKRISSSSVEW